MQLAHAGRKGSTKLPWHGTDEPLDEGNWQILSASPIPFKIVSDTPKEMDRADMDRVRDDFVAAAKRADEAGFDMIELHMAHGYLLSSFISPLSNKRADEYGGSLEDRSSRLPPYSSARLFERGEMKELSKYPCAICNSIISKPASSARFAAATKSSRTLSMSARSISLGVSLTILKGIGEAERICQLPSSRGSSVPCQGNLVDPFLPAWANCMQNLAWLLACTNSTIRFQAGTCAS